MRAISSVKGPFQARLARSALPAGRVAPTAVSRSEAVDPAFGALQSEYLVAVGRWQEQARAAKLAGAAGHPPHALPRPPAPEFFPRFEALASRGSFAALRWCVQHSESELGAP